MRELLRQLNGVLQRIDGRRDLRKPLLILMEIRKAEMEQYVTISRIRYKVIRDLFEDNGQADSPRCPAGRGTQPARAGTARRQRQSR
jgi:hypothetical protein